MRRALVSIGEADTAVNAIAQKVRMDVNFILCVGRGWRLERKGIREKGVVRQSGFLFRVLGMT